MQRFLLMSITLIGGCVAPAVSYAPTNPAPRPTAPRSAEEVAVIFTPPACPYVEIGLVETTAPVLRRDWTIPEKIERMRAAAAARGADAIVMLGHDDSAGGHHNTTVSHNYSGVAIAFLEPAGRCAPAVTTSGSGGPASAGL